MINANSFVFFKDNIKREDLNPSKVNATLLFKLETAIYTAMQEKQYSTDASNAKFPTKLNDLEAKI